MSNISDNSTSVGDESTKLSELFNNAFELFNNINKSDLPTNSTSIQSDIKHALTMFENATRLVSLADMFSKNESFEEIPTENIKYFLLPALLGVLTTKICGTADRFNIINVAEVYFVDFLKRLNEYGIININISAIKRKDTDEDRDSRSKSNAQLITEMVNTRNAKLQRYKEQKELEARLEVLKKNIDNPTVDDETKREYFSHLVKLFANQAIDELTSIASEIPILEHMKNVRHDELSHHKHHKQPSAKLQPIIITRNEVQKQVYGAGYPSLPVLTVEEFYEKKIKDGEWSATSHHHPLGSTHTNDENQQLKDEREAEDKEERTEKDDPELIAQTRAMDEYKDTHRRGWGNRANRS